MPKNREENTGKGDKNGIKDGSTTEEAALAAAKYAARFEDWSGDGKDPEASMDSEYTKEEACVTESSGEQETFKNSEDPENSGVSEDSGDLDEESEKGREKKDKKDIQIEELEDRLRRNMAEFDNFRKRTDKEKAGMFGMGAAHVAEKILPVLDNFERALAGVPEDVEAMAYAKGVDMIYKQFLKILEEIGVTPIECLGKEFDPHFHNAVMHVEDEEVGENTIVEELQKGYLYKDTVLRYSMVKVAN